MSITTFIILPLASLPDFSALQYASGSAICIYLAFTATLVALYLSEHLPLEPAAALFKPDPGAFFR